MKTITKVFLLVFLVVFTAGGAGAQVLVDSGYPVYLNSYYPAIGIAFQSYESTFFLTGQSTLTLYASDWSSDGGYTPYPLVYFGNQTSGDSETGFASGANVQAVMEFVLYETTLDSLTPYNFTARLGQFSVFDANSTGDSMSVGLFDLGDGTEDGFVNADDFGSVRGHIATLFTQIPGEGAVFDNIDVTEALRHDILTGETTFGEGAVPAVITGFLLKTTWDYRRPGIEGTCNNFDQLNPQGEGGVGFCGKCHNCPLVEEENDAPLRILLMPDSDGDGVNDVEDGYPQDPGKATPPSSEGNGNLTIASDSGTLRDVEPIEGDDPCLSNVPDGLVFADGLVSYRVTGLSLGETVTVQLSFPSVVSGDFYKADCDGYFESFPYTLIDSHTIEITLTDGGAGDLDGVANGEILDPGGMGQYVSPGGSSSSSSGSGSHSHCFISILGLFN